MIVVEAKILKPTETDLTLSMQALQVFPDPSTNCMVCSINNLALDDVPFAPTHLNVIAQTTSKTTQRTTTMLLCLTRLVFSSDDCGCKHHR